MDGWMDGWIDSRPKTDRKGTSYNNNGKEFSQELCGANMLVAAT
jgi:hypothetical protein